MTFRGILPSILLLGALTACSGTHTDRFDVSVKNDLDKPITLFLTKSGPPLEDGWWSPEDLSFRTAAGDESIVGQVIDPGRTAASGPIEGTFDRGSMPYLRIYAGKHSLPDLLATSGGHPDRLDIPLPVGKTEWIVNRREGRLIVTTPGK